ncbi:hypothetical protein CI102_7168, partial [Trichoderma harzianum]
AFVNHTSGMSLEKYYFKPPKSTTAAVVTLSELFMHHEVTGIYLEITYSKRHQDQMANALDFLIDMIKTTYAANVELISRHRTRPNHDTLSAMLLAAVVDSFQDRSAD